MDSEDAVIIAQGLECCLCFELFTEPTRLSCTHTFCKKCLDLLYESQPQPNQLPCPMCRQVTNINNGDISKLPINIPIRSLTEEVKSAKRSCTVCDPEAKSVAVQYCMQCDEYMCKPCTVAHGKFKKTAKHNKFTIDDVMMGKVKVKRFCNKHQEEEKLYVCTSCNVSVCFRCCMLNHSKPDHVIEEVSDFKKTIQKRIKSLQEKATAKIAMIQTHAGLVNEQKALVEIKIDKTIAEINQAYEEAVQHLTKQHNDLTNWCKQEKETLTAKLEKIKESNDKLMSCIGSASELVGNGIKTLLEGQTMAVHNTICCDLQKILDESNPDAKKLKSISDHANRLKFVGSVSPNLGDLRRYDDWLLEEVSTFPLSYEQAQGAVALSDGRVAVGYIDGEVIEVYTLDGSQETVLRGVMVSNVFVLSDGRYVVVINDNITLYTQAWERLDVQFNSPSNVYSMCIDRSDNIYVGYLDTRKIVVFRPEGATPLRQIPCHDREPWEICHMNHSKRMVVGNADESVSIIDDVTGTILIHIEVDNSKPHIAVLKDDSVLIECWKDEQLNLKRYTKDLEMINTVLSDFPMECDIRKLIELPTGDIVLISAEDFTVLKKSTST